MGIRSPTLPPSELEAGFQPNMDDTDGGEFRDIPLPSEI